MRCMLFALLLSAASVPAFGEAIVQPADVVAALPGDGPAVREARWDTPRPRARDNEIPRARWEHRRDGDLWTRVVMASVEAHGRPLIETVPDDIAEWCPTYPEQTVENRSAFWSALLSTLARYESTWDEDAVGGGGQWHGLMQILPQTAEFRGCRAVTGRALRDGTENLSCAVRIMAITVPRDNAISLKGEERWRGVAADWGPIRNDWMRRDMQRYTRKQTYCRPLSEVRPRARPGEF